MTACANASMIPLTARKLTIAANPPRKNNSHIILPIFDRERSTHRHKIYFSYSPRVADAPSASAQRFPYRILSTICEYCGPIEACATKFKVRTQQDAVDQLSCLLTTIKPSKIATLSSIENTLQQVSMCVLGIRRN